jgi:hypothetical protein
MPAPGFAERRAVASWQAAQAALREIRAADLRALTDHEAVLAFADLYALVAGEPIAREVTGLVEQQRLFARLRS